MLHKKAIPWDGFFYIKNLKLESDTVSNIK